MTRTLFAMILLLSGAAAAVPPNAGAGTGEVMRRLLAASPSTHAGPTRCDACHTTEGWHVVTFPHERTGFPLRGSHAEASCAQCHPGGYVVPVSQSCTSCHRDVHQGSFGALCTSCHDETSWQARYTADAHRRTNFPLTGGHAVLPCLECHQDVRDRSFSPGVVECAKCHQADYHRTALGLVKHQSLGFSTDCSTCHDGFRFARGAFPDHERCFALGGPHAGIACEGCHTSLPATNAPGTCATGTASCTGCHVHACERTDAKHKSVPGYQCKDRKCYECHRFVAR